MSENDFEMNYELVNENVLLYNRADLNKLTIAEGEDLNHFGTKTLLFYILSELDHDLICDFTIPDLSTDDWRPMTVDLYDLSSRTIYQIENNNTINELQLIKNDILLKNYVDVIIIHLEDLPDDLFQRYLKLKEYVFID